MKEPSMTNATSSDIPSSHIPSGHTTSATSHRFALLAEHTPRLVAAVAVLTGLLIIPFLTMAPTTSASTEPSGAVFDARDLVDERFVSSVYQLVYIAQPPGGDALLAEPLRALQTAQQSLRTDAELSATMLEVYNPETDFAIDGPFSLVDLVEAELQATTGAGLDGADDQAVKAAGARLIERLGADSPALGLSQQSSADADGNWTVPAVVIAVLSDDNVLGFGNQSVNLGADTAPETYARSVQDVLRTAEGWSVHGVAIDVNLTSEEQGALAGPFIGFTVLAALLLVAFMFRSYWVLAVVGALFLVLLIWLKGMSNLLGFKDDLILSLIVPVAMISFGVDYAFHSIGRYREERALGLPARPAAAVGGAAVSGALVLATISDSVAFLANVTAGIESVIQFGLGSALALVSAYLLLGLVAPLVVGLIESQVPAPKAGRVAVGRRIGAAAFAAMGAMASVLLLVFVLPWLGVIVATITIIGTLVVPFFISRRRLERSEAKAVGELPVAAGSGRLPDLLGRTVALVARQRRIVLPAALAITVVASLFAVQVPARFDVEDFFTADSDFVVGLDLLDQHVGSSDGEPATMYIEGDLRDPALLAVAGEQLPQLRSLDTSSLARNDDGVWLRSYGIWEVFDATWTSPIMTGLVASDTGVELTDTNGDGIPDTRAQIDALLSVASLRGVPLDQERLALTPNDIALRVDLDQETPGNDATGIVMAIVNSRDQGSVQEARDALQPIAQQLSEDLGGTFVQATGSPLAREASLEGTNRALLVSLPIALLACLFVASLFLRSLRYGLASVVPILMVVAWLYAFMEIAGFAINLVTATIAAVSIGIGIDFALHFVTRFIEEMERAGDRIQAVRAAGEGTGLALFASAFSSAIGFGIMAFAPMPLFASYGLLTAVMILLALVATLVVLPGLLLAVTSPSKGRTANNQMTEADVEAGKIANTVTTVSTASPAVIEGAEGVEAGTTRVVVEEGYVTSSTSYEPDDQTALVPADEEVEVTMTNTLIPDPTPGPTPTPAPTSVLVKEPGTPLIQKRPSTTVQLDGPSTTNEDNEIRTPRSITDRTPTLAPAPPDTPDELAATRASTLVRVKAGLALLVVGLLLLARSRRRRRR